MARQPPKAGVLLAIAALACSVPLAGRGAELAGAALVIAFLIVIYSVILRGH